MRIASLLIAVTISLPGFNALAADEPVILISRFSAAPGQEGALEDRLRKAVEFVRKAEPATIYRVQRSKKDPSQFVFYEVYPSQAALDHHAKVVLPAFNKEVGARPEGMLARPPESELFRPLD